MNRHAIALWVLFSLLVAGLAHAALYFPRLPGRVASHFGAGGKPDGWSTRTEFVGVHAATLVGAAMVTLAIPRLVRVLPSTWISLPHAGYWLAAERKDETVQYLARWMMWLGSATLALFIGIGDLAFRANLRADPALGGAVWWPLGAYFAFVAVWIAALYVRFWRVPRG